MRIEKAKGIETSMVNQTKQALEASLKHLLLQKPLDKITISDLTKDCGKGYSGRLRNKPYDILLSL